MNEVFLIGKIHQIKVDDDKEYQFILEVKRPFKNEKGEFINDYFCCQIWKGAMDVMTGSCRVGDIVALKARLEGSIDDSKLVTIIAEKIKFIYKDNHYQKNY
jgi:single-stranded DNA-binding protein